MSVDRSMSVEVADEIVMLAHSFRHDTPPPPPPPVDTSSNASDSSSSSSGGGSGGGGGGGGVVAGLDFSGNPSKGAFAKFTGVMTKARQLGLRITAHVGAKHIPLLSRFILKLIILPR